MAHFATQRVVDNCHQHLDQCGQGALVQQQRPEDGGKSSGKRKLRIKSRTAPTAQKPAVEAQQSGWCLAGQWLDSLDSEAVLSMPCEFSLCDEDLDLAVAMIGSLLDRSVPNAARSVQRTTDLSAHHPRKSQRIETPQCAAGTDKGFSGTVNLPHLPDIQNDVQDRSQIDSAADHSWMHHCTTNPHSYQSFPPRWENAQAQPQNQQALIKQFAPNPFKRTAMQLSYPVAGWAGTLAEQQMAQQHFSAMPPPSQPNGSTVAAQPSAERTSAQELSARQQAAALDRLQQMSADLQAANERIARDAQTHRQTMEEERRRHKDEIQRLQESNEGSQQALRDELASERKVTAQLRQQLEEKRSQHQAEEQAGAETATLRKAMELRIGIQAPSELLTGRQEFLKQADIAQKFWAQFETSAAAVGVSSSPSKVHSASCKDLETAAKFDEAAHGVCKGLLAAVMLLNSAAHQFQHGLDDVARRRGDLVGGRTRIREAQEKLRKIGGLISFMSEANAILASAGGTIEHDGEYARRAVFVQASSVCQRRLITIGEHEYLSYERISVQQTRQHANAKHIEFVRLRETLKQLSPASDTSCADVATISPRTHGRSGGGLNDTTQTLLDLGQGFHLAQKRLEAAVDSALKVTQEAPRLQEDLLRLFNALGHVGSSDVVSKGRSIAWAMAAITGEFGCNVNQNVGTLQYAVETLKSLISAEATAKIRGAKKRVAS